MVFGAVRPIGRAALTIPRCIVFDMDGTIINSSPLHLEAWTGVTRRVDPSCLLRATPQIMGHTSEDTVKLLGLPKCRTREIVEMKIGMYDEMIKAQLLKGPESDIIVPGFRSFFDSLKGFSRGLATAAIRDEAEFVLSSIGILNGLNAVVTASEFTKNKPDPEPYLMTLEKLGCIDMPHQCVGFEDTLMGVQAVKAAGMKCVVVGTSLTPALLQEAGQPYDLFIPDYTHIDLPRLSLLFSL